MAKTELFVVRKIGDNLYENSTYGIVGNDKLIKEYAETHHYGGGVVVYVGQGNGNWGGRLEFEKI